MARACAPSSADMFAKGYITQLDGTAPRERQALWVELGLVPVEAEANLQRTSIGVMSVPGDGAASRGRAGAGAPRQAAPACGSWPQPTPIWSSSRSRTICMATSRRSTGRCAATAATGRCSNRAAACLSSARCFAPARRRAGPACRAPWSRTGRATPCWPAARWRRGRRAAAARRRASLAVNFAAFELARAAAGKGLSQPRPQHHQPSISRPARAASISSGSIRTVRFAARRGTTQESLERASRPLVLASRPVLPQVDGGWRSVADGRGDAGPRALCQSADRHHLPTSTTARRATGCRSSGRGRPSPCRPIRGTTACSASRAAPPARDERGPGPGELPRRGDGTLSVRLYRPRAAPPGAPGRSSATRRRIPRPA